jgi:hypothetical protein
MKELAVHLAITGLRFYDFNLKVRLVLQYWERTHLLSIKYINDQEFASMITFYEENI